MARIDRTNLRLLELLQKDGRMSVTDLARAVGRAESTVRERIAALERDGVIAGYRAVVDPGRLGYGVRAIVRADTDLTRVDGLARELAAVPNVVGAQLTTGRRPLRIELLAEDLSQVEDVLVRRLAPLQVAGAEIAAVVRQLVGPRPVAVHAALGPAALPAGEDAPEEDEAPTLAWPGLIAPAPGNGRRVAARLAR